MKRTNLLLSLGAALLLAPLTSALAQSAWETVDDLIPWRGRDIVADSAGTFYSLSIDNGTTGNTGPVSTAVSASIDHGATWQTVGFIAGYASDLTAAPDGALFAVGNRSTTVSGRAFVWQSLDHGATWTVFDPSVGLSTVLLSTDLAAGNSGAIYVCGTSGGRWTIRKGQRAGSGITWSTVDNFAGNTPGSICVRPAAAPGQPDEVLVIGVASSAWVVRRSVNSGATWTTADSYSTGRNLGAGGIAAGLDGSTYLVIPTVKTVGKTTVYGWLVRKSASGGTGWANVDSMDNVCPLNSPIAVREIVDIGEKLRKHKIRVKEIIRDADEDDQEFDEEEADRRIIRLIDKVKRLDKKHTDLAEERPNAKDPRRKAIDADIIATQGELVETLEEMRLNKKTIDKIVQKLKGLISKVERAEAGATELERRTGLNKNDQRQLANFTTDAPTVGPKAPPNEASPE